MTIRLSVIPDQLVFPGDMGYVVEPTMAVTPGEWYEFSLGPGSGGAVGSWRCPPGVTRVQKSTFGSAGSNVYPIRNLIRTDLPAARGGVYSLPNITGKVGP